MTSKTWTELYYLRKRVAIGGSDHHPLTQVVLTYHRYDNHQSRRRAFTPANHLHNG